MGEGIKKIGEIEGIGLYFDEYVEENNFFMGRKSKEEYKSGLVYMPYLGKISEDISPLPDIKEDLPKRLPADIDFIIGSTMDIEKYKKALKGYKKSLKLYSEEL
jgi:hypothetical protein